MSVSASYPEDLRLTQAIPGWESRLKNPGPRLVGVLRGEGVGPEVVDGALRVLEEVGECSGVEFDLRYGGSIGLSALRESGLVLTPGVEQFCTDILSAGGALLCGPGGSRFVYELRARFDLFCKLTPVQPVPVLRNVGVFNPGALAGVDVLIVRENVGGVYFGDYGETGQGGKRRAFHNFHYDDAQVARILNVALGIAGLRRGRLCMIYKPGGVPAISHLWEELMRELSAGSGIDVEFLEADTANYRLIANAAGFDVIVAPNMCGDILADGAAALLGSRGMSYSANFSDAGVGVYQTAHGAAYDLAGRDLANPLGQIFSLAMMLRENFNLAPLARLVQESMSDVLAAGWRTGDVLEAGSRCVGTREMSDRVAGAFRSRYKEMESQAR